MFILDKKAVLPVVSFGLLLLMSVGFFLVFSNWYFEQNSELYVNVYESEDEFSIEEINGDNLLLFSLYETQIDSLTIMTLEGSSMCELSGDILIASEITPVNISSCSLTQGEVYLALVYTPKHFAKVNVVAK